MTKITAMLQSAIKVFFHLSCYLLILLVALVCFCILLSKIFAINYIWMQELQLYFFGYLFLFGSAYTLQQEGHVKVDIFYQKLSVQKQKWVNVLGCVLFLLPTTILLIYFGFLETYKSFYPTPEHSNQVGGLKYIGIIKIAIPLGSLLLFFQTILTLIATFTSPPKIENHELR